MVANWLLNIRASHHVTLYLGNLSLHTPYDGPDDMIDDGMGLPITHTVSMILSSPYNSLIKQCSLCSYHAK